MRTILAAARSLLLVGSLLLACGTGKLPAAAAVPAAAMDPQSGISSDENRPLSNLAAIDTAAGYTCVLTAAGSVMCWGDNSYGQLGDGTTTGRLVPLEVGGLVDVQAISTGVFHACALTAAGGVKCWGSNQFGQLGDGSTKDRSRPVDVVGLAGGVRAISAGGFHTCALTVDDRVKCWGHSGQVGAVTPTVAVTTPLDVTGFSSGVEAIAAGDMHTCALTKSGGVKCWGNNNRGQLGDGTANYHSTLPVDVVGLDGDILAISAGTHHTCALTLGRTVKCWGDNYYGELGNGKTDFFPVSIPVAVGTLGGVQSISTGASHTCAVTETDGAKCWGHNESGQLGDESGTIFSATPVAVRDLASGVQAVSAGPDYTCALTVAGSAKCWGYNGTGQLGNRTTTDHWQPAVVNGLSEAVKAVAVGKSHMCALTSSGSVKCWGSNQMGQLGNGTRSASWMPVDVSGLAGGIGAIAVGQSHGCALTKTGGVKCWGSNSSGQLGDGTKTERLLPVDVIGLTSDVQAISAGASHTCALTADGGVKCWGDNSYGQLGNTQPGNSLAPVEVIGLNSPIRAIAAGSLHTCALTNNGGLMCWGYNLYGQLGTGTNASSPWPEYASGLVVDVQAVAAGAFHTCALTSPAHAKCWGYNHYGQLGDGTREDRSIQVDVLGLSGGVQALSAGAFHTCALTAAGVKCWGDDHVDLRGLATGIQAVSAGTNCSCALTAAGALKCWGNNAYGQLGLDPGWAPVDVLDSPPPAEPSLYLPALGR